MNLKMSSRWDERGLKDLILIMISLWKENENYTGRKRHLDVIVLNFWLSVTWGK